MKTLTRPFVLHLIVALLTFKIGVLAAIMLGHFNPLDRHYGRHHRGHRCGEHQQLWTPPPPPLPPAPVAPEAVLPPRIIYPVYRPEQTFDKTARPFHQRATPLLPSFEDEGEPKSSGAAAPAHRSR
jgi:hypothetical protein